MVLLFSAKLGLIREPFEAGYCRAPTDILTPCRMNGLL
jgi:hypothetical protein